VIDENAKRGIEAHCEKFARRGRVLKQLPVPAEGLFVAPR
jgi:RHH-type transcriptional regulator, proline utilization regulon repressor / proline dehydrogenase / delta 1-pyrroline-5-carboxylate dehydrogenase